MRQADEPSGTGGSGGEVGRVGARADGEGSDDVVLRDVETRLSRTLDRYERVLANVADGIYGLDAAGRVEFVNPAAVRITGRPAEEQLGHDQHAVIHGRRPDGSPYPKEQCPVWHALQTGRPVAADSEVFWRRDGTPVPVELIAVPTVEDGAVTGVVVSFRDLTDRVAARRQAAELRRVTERAAAQRALSDRLQQALLTPPPEPDHLQVVVRYRPAAHEAQVGGDWYDAFLQPDGATMLVIGDVVGHDSDAAAAMGQLRGVLRVLAYDNDEPPSATLSRAEHVARGLAVSTLATVVLARIERRPDVPVTGTRVLRWSNAGHLPPLLLAPDGTSTLLETRPELMLGIDPDAPRTDHTAELADGHTLLLVTDGLVERRGHRPGRRAGRAAGGAARPRRDAAGGALRHAARPDAARGRGGRRRDHRRPDPSGGPSAAARGRPQPPSARRRLTRTARRPPRPEPGRALPRGPVPGPPSACEGWGGRSPSVDDDGRLVQADVGTDPALTLADRGQRTELPVPRGGEEAELALRAGDHLGGELVGGVEQPHVRPGDGGAVVPDLALDDRLGAQVHAGQRAALLGRAAHAQAPFAIGTPTREPYSVQEPS